jgi:hypothetical protein
MVDPGQEPLPVRWGFADFRVPAIDFYRYENIGTPTPMASGMPTFKKPNPVNPYGKDPQNPR